MPFRERMKKVFKPHPSTHETPTTDNVSAEPLKDPDVPDVYQPGEPMPLKYKRPPDPKHTERLQAFSFGSMFRRKSDQSLYSPMGSRLPSRRNSTWSIGRRKSGAGPSRATSRVDQVRDVEMKEGDDEDGDVGNVGLSRQATRDRPRRSADPSRNQMDAEFTGPPRITVNGHASGGRPFSEEELAEALRKTQLQISEGGTPGVR